MTREEAHSILSNGLFQAPSEHAWCMAFEMAIKALEQEPCGDAISKESLLARLRLNYSKNQNVSLQALVDIVNTERPITPARRVGEWIVLRDEYGDIVEAVCSCCDANGNHKWE